MKILKEEKNLTELSETVNTFYSKLKSMEEHLKALIAKKLRIELEIKSLKKSMREKVKHSNKNVKLSLSLEDSELITQGSESYRICSEAGLLPLLREIDLMETRLDFPVDSFLQEETN